MTVSLPANVLSALDILILERVNEHSLTIVGTTPSWFTKLYPQVQLTLDVAWIERKLPFLANFLVDAMEFWHDNQPGQYKSGMWCETDHRDQEIHLEAAALNLGSQKSSD